MKKSAQASLFRQGEHFCPNDGEVLLIQDGWLFCYRCHYMRCRGCGLPIPPRTEVTMAQLSGQEPYPPAPDGYCEQPFGKACYGRIVDRLEAENTRLRIQLKRKRNRGRA